VWNGDEEPVAVSDVKTSPVVKKTKFKIKN